MNNFTTGNIPKQLTMFALPMLVGSLFQQLYGIVDAVVVGRFIGGGALGAVGISLSVFHFLTAALIGLTTGASVIISQFYGADNQSALKKAMSTSVLFLAGFSVLITIIGVVFTPAILRMLDAPEDIFYDSAAYMRIQMGGLIFPVFFNMYTAYLRAIGNSKTPLYILVGSLFLNAVLSVICVLGFGMGVYAVAVTTVISQGLAAAACYFYTAKKVPLLRVRNFIFDNEMFVAILKYGTPAALQLSIVSLAMLTITRLINSFGSAAIAGITAAGRIDQMALIPVSTFSLALSTFVAQNMGAGLEERARKGLKITLLYTIVLAAAISLFVVFLGSPLVSMFIDAADADAAEILRIGQNHLSIMAAFYVLFGILFAYNGFYRGAGDAVIAMVFPVISLTVRTLSAYALVHLAGMGPEALGWSIPIGWGLTSVASYWYYRKGSWRGKVIAANNK